MILIAGEALIDMVADNDSHQKFTGVPGGAAYNVACALGLFKANPSFACPISNDHLGTSLLERMQNCGATPFLANRVDAPTPLALVTVNSTGQPRYSFYREGTADRMLEQLNQSVLLAKAVKLMHITGFCLNEADDYQQWLKLVKAAKAAGAIISVDPNVRESLISDPMPYRERIKALLSIAHIVKVSDEDLLYLYPEMTLEEAINELKVLCLLSIVTRGAEGADVYWNEQMTHVNAQKVEQVVDTVGAGDSFSAAYLYQLYMLNILTPEAITALSEEQIERIITFAGIAAAINCGRKGCQPPTLKEISDYPVD